VVSLVVAYAVAKALGYDVGQAAGLLAGSQTISGLLGTAAEAINKLAIPDDEKKRLVDAMPVAYAVTYIFGTAASAWILSSLGPKLVGGNVEAACKEYEATRPRQSQSAELNSGPGFVASLREAGLSLFLAGILVTAIPLLVGLLVARYVFRFHPGIALGCVAGARTTGAARWGRGRT
jgi:uncharacterized transporter YbjL